MNTKLRNDQEEFEDKKGVFRICKLKKRHTTRWQQKKDKGINNGLQNITHKYRDRVTRIPLKSGVNTGDPGG